MVHPADTEYITVQGLVRGLEVLVALNRRPIATASAVELSAETGLHRTTVKRLLETLRASGFVSFIPESNSYRLTFRVQQLSEGFRPEGWVWDVARPLMRSVTERILWPCSIMTREKEALVVRESTHHFSPLSFHSGALGASIPMIRTAAGRAYLAFCSTDEREILLTMLRDRDDDEGAFARDERRVRKLLDATVEQGFAINEGDWIGKGRYGAIAVPIVVEVKGEEKVIGCLDTVFSKRAITVKDAAEKFAPELMEAAIAIQSGAKYQLAH